MRDKVILTICRQSLNHVKGAVRAYNMYRSLKRLGCNIIYLDGWKPSFQPNMKNIKNWSKILMFKCFDKKNTRIFIENVIDISVIRILEKLNIPLILDVRDDFILHAESMGINISKEAALQHEKNQLVCFEIAEKVFVTSQSMKEYYLEKYGKRLDDKVVVIMNAAVPEYFKASPLPSEPRIGILGGANQGQGFNLLLEAAKIVKRSIPKLTVHIGYSYMHGTKGYIDFLIKKYTDDWFYFYEDITYPHKAAQFYSTLYLCVISNKNTISNNLTTPSRLFDCMAAQRPVVVTACREQAKIVLEENCGLVSDFTEFALAEKIIYLLQSRHLASIMAQNGRRAAVDKHNWSIRSKTIIESVFAHKPLNFRNNSWVSHELR